MVRKVPLDELEAVFTAHARANYNKFTPPVQFVASDEFWPMVADPSTLPLPCLVFEVETAQFNGLGNGVVETLAKLKAHYLAQLPESGQSRSILLKGSRVLAELFVRGSLKFDPELTFIDTATKESCFITRCCASSYSPNNSLANDNIIWGEIEILATIHSYPRKQ